MQIVITRHFAKDVDKELSKALQLQLSDLIQRLQTASSLKDIPGLKKLSGFRNAYRIRMGEYRIGFLLEDNTIRLSRIMNRKEIYRFFP